MAKAGARVVGRAPRLNAVASVWDEASLPASDFFSMFEAWRGERGGGKKKGRRSALCYALTRS